MKSLNLKKALVIFLALVIATIATWKIFIATDFSDTTECFSKQAQIQNSIYKEAVNIKSKEEQQQFICSKDEESYYQLLDCLKKCKRDNSISFFIYSKLPRFRKTIKETIVSHNKICPSSKLSTPAFIN